MKPRQARTAPNVSQSAPEPAPIELPPSRERALFAASSVLLLAPCFWQSRLQIGDLESHIYNAWLAQLIESGTGSRPGDRFAEDQCAVRLDPERAISIVGRGSGAEDCGVSVRTCFCVGRIRICLQSVGTASMAPDAADRRAVLRVDAAHGFPEFLPEPGAVPVGNGAGMELDPAWAVSGGVARSDRLRGAHPASNVGRGDHGIRLAVAAHSGYSSALI